jgi:hypothetical protein
VGGRVRDSDPPFPSIRDGDEDSRSGAEDDASSRTGGARPKSSWVCLSVVCCPLLALVWLLAFFSFLVLEVARGCVAGCGGSVEEEDVEGDAEMDWDWDEEEAFGMATGEQEEGHIEGDLGFVGAEEATEVNDSGSGSGSQTTAAFQPSVADSEDLLRLVGLGGARRRSANPNPYTIIPKPYNPSTEGLD